MIIVTSYTNPDLDGFACALAYAEFLQRTGAQAQAVIFGTPRQEAQYLAERFHIDYPAPYEITAYDSIILVDASDTRGIDARIMPAQVSLVIDHRKAHMAHADFPHAQVQVELVGSAATLIAEKFHAVDMHPSVASATLLYGAIISNTLNFQASVTTMRDHDMATWLATMLLLPADFTQAMFAAKSDLSGEKLAEAMAGETAWFAIAGAKIGIVQLEITGGRQLLAERLPEVQKILEHIRTERQLDDIFLTIVALDDACNYLCAPSQAMQTMLTEKVGVIFNEIVARREGFIMRKEIVPLLLA